MIKVNFKQRIKAVLSLDSHPGHIAAGFAVGVFISITPFFGFHTFLAIMFAIIFKLNKLTTITGSMVNTPLTVVPFLMVNYRLGEFILGQHPRAVSFQTLDWYHLKEHAQALLIGCSITGLVTALVSYFIIYRLVLRFQQNDLGLSELSRASVVTGESIEHEEQEK